MTTSQAPSDAERASRRRLQVLAAAARCFRQYGFHGCSMAQLAKEAGMSVGHIYHYFENKEAIIEALVQKDLDEWLTSISHLLHSDQIYEEIIARLDERAPMHFSADFAALQLEIFAEAARNPRVAEMVRARHLQMRDSVTALLLNEGSQQRTQSEIHTKIELLCSLFEGFMVRTICCASHIDQQALLALTRPTVRFILEH